MAAHTVHTVGHSAHSAEESVELLQESGAQRLVVVATECAEPVRRPRHRSLGAEALLLRGYDVQHIMGPGQPNPATPRDVAVVEGDRITHPGGEPCST
ncbi:hypothetical protein [Kocuria kalidii]|uniref:hypothetical protein n=1 Tax=Kocuria kalidii TaxID=3376283 RepID=UPI0037A12719